MRHDEQGDTPPINWSTKATTGLKSKQHLIVIYQTTTDIMYDVLSYKLILKTNSIWNNPLRH
jgi:hypothetical protein